VATALTWYVAFVSCLQKELQKLAQMTFVASQGWRYDVVDLSHSAKIEFPLILLNLFPPMASTLDELMDITKLPREKMDPWYRRLRAQFDQAQ
jgi:hypothetical protein